MKGGFLAALAAVLLLALAPAGASAATPTPTNSEWWDGYAAFTPSDSVIFNSVTATWIQPKLTCPQLEDSVVTFFAGLDGLANQTGIGDEEQAGTEAHCDSSAPPSYSAFWAMPGTGIMTVPSLAVSPGDKITATVSFVAPTFELTVKDVTSGRSFTTGQSCTFGKCSRVSAEVIAGDPDNTDTTDDDLAQYGKVTFSAIKIHTSHGKQGGFSNKNWSTAKITQFTRATVSTLTSAGAFTDTWKTN